MSRRLGGSREEKGDGDRAAGGGLGGRMRVGEGVRVRRAARAASVLGWEVTLGAVGEFRPGRDERVEEMREDPSEDTNPAVGDPSGRIGDQEPSMVGEEVPRGHIGTAFGRRQSSGSDSLIEG